MTKPVNMRISPKYFGSDLIGASVNKKIDIFEDRILGWVLHQAGRALECDPEADFIVLAAIASYFESIEIYRQGEGESKVLFRRSVERVLAREGAVHSPLTVPQVDRFYKGLRCALYHRGFPSGFVAVDPSLDVAVEHYPHAVPIEFGVNAQRLLEFVILDFVLFTIKLRDPRQEELRDRFERLFDSA